MINYNPKSWVQLIFAFHKADTFRILWKEIIYICLFTLAITFVVKRIEGAEVLEKLIRVYSLIGFVISLLLVFRTNTAYDRWWEGRRKWGELVNDSRNLAVKLSALLKRKEDRYFFERMIRNYVISMKEQLRQGVDLDDLNFTEAEKEELLEREHIPVAIVEMIYQRLKELNTDGVVSDNDLLILDKNVNSLLDSLGACERIKNTPIPFSYSLFIKKFIFVYVTTLPLAFVNIFGYASALIATFVFYVLVSMEVLAEEIEDPFGRDDNDLPTDQLSDRISRILKEVLA